MMMKNLFLLFLVSLTTIVNGQSIISGIVTDNNDLPIIGANVYLEGTYDGDVTDLDGKFSFKTNEENEQTLSISYLGYETKSITGPIETLATVRIKLRESVTALDAVTITSSTFEAGDNSKVAVLKPMDILTTAGSVGDVIAGMQTLPGTQSNADDGRLFVRGGDARETAIYIDGLRVFSPYMKTIGGSPTRGRYSPLLFKGVSFSTGAYGAAYGQALSGVLNMKSIDEPTETMTNINLMSIGGGVGHTQKWNNQSLSVNTNYVNLKPYDLLVPSRVDWKKPFQGYSGEAIYRLKTKNGMFKSYLAGDVADFELFQTNFNSGQKELIDINNNNIYSNTNYLGFLSDKTSVYAGISFGMNGDRSNLDNQFEENNDQFGVHVLVSGKTIFSDRFKTDYGVDYMMVDDKQINKVDEIEDERSLNKEIGGAYVEADYFFNKNLAIKTAVRSEYNGFTDELSFLPRMTMALKLDKESQLSASYGRYNQDIETRFTFIDTPILQETATHYTLNFNRKVDRQILRLETYYKSYDNLLTYDKERGIVDNITNAGDGYAYGLDLFYRANGVVKNLDMWVSYSWLQNERKYQDFRTPAPTQFSSEHNLSLVGKYFAEELRSQISMTYNMTSGRPYHNPNTAMFMSERSKYFHSINLSWAYLVSDQKILFVSVSNATRFKNSYGYEYKNQANELGVFEGKLIRPNDDQFFFAGFFITLSKNKNNNQLNNL